MSDDPASAFRVAVVIGASAGGIDALSDLLAPLQAAFPASIVVAHHEQPAEPARATDLAEILSGRTALRVTAVEQRERLVPGTVYVVPSDHTIVITEHAVEARETREPQDDLEATEREGLALIFDGMSEAVLVVDRDGGIVASNRAYRASFGPDRQLVPEDGSGRRLPEDEWPQARAARGEAFAMSFTRVDEDGDRRWYEASGRPGGDWGGIIVIRDITERSLRHLQERFIDTASHELQTPLAALHNYLQLVERADGLDEAAQRYLAGALEQSRYLGELAARLFDVSLIRHGRVVVQRTPVDLRELLTLAVANVRELHPEVELRLHAGSRRMVVAGDRLRLRQVLSNLLVNAVTHGASSQAVDVSLRDRDGSAIVTVSDRGRGIAPEALPRLFTPFAAVSTDAVSGLGLGLFVAHEITLEHGGNLAVEPREGGGTVARLTLPLTGDAGRGPTPGRSRSRKEAAP